MLVKLARFKINKCLERGNAIKFCWVPSHVGITGNEKADQLATSARNFLETPRGIPFQDVKPLVRKALFCSWQSEWNLEDTNKLHIVKPVLGSWDSSSHKNRFHEVLLCRLRIGHTFVTHSHLLCGDDAPDCDRCGGALTVLHVLWLCPGLEQDRRACFPEFFAYQIPFHPALLLGEHPIVPFERIVNFLQKSGYLHKF